jgi:transmembrane sensor
MNTQIYEEATDWLVKHREGDLDPQEKAHFDAWLRESPQHVRAYLEMSAIWEDLPALGADWNPTASELIARSGKEDNVRPLVGAVRLSGKATDARHAAPASDSSRPQQSSRARVLVIAASFLIGIWGLATWYVLERNTYATDIGEQRSIVLSDGSTLELDSRSRVRIRYTEAQRHVDLLEGQAIFRVAPNTSRPFVVHSGITNVLAVGTQFDVYKKPAATIVTVIDGRVQILARAPSSTAPNRSAATPLTSAASESGGNKAVLLSAGEQVIMPADRPVRVANGSPGGNPQPANVATATAWTQHNLVFESSALTEVAEEFNRYNRRPLVITDPVIATMRISGMFSSIDPAVLLKFLRAQPELKVEETDREIRVSRR